jgi:hypothetical protein
MTDDWAQLKVTDPMEAEILKAALESADIPVALLGESVGRLMGVPATELGEVHVLVPPDRIEEARALVESAESVDFPEGD